MPKAHRFWFLYLQALTNLTTPVLPPKAKANHSGLRKSPEGLPSKGSSASQEGASPGWAWAGARDLTVIGKNGDVPEKQWNLEACVLVRICQHLSMHSPSQPRLYQGAPLPNPPSETIPFCLYWETIPSFLCMSPGLPRKVGNLVVAWMAKMSSQPSVSGIWVPQSHLQ